MEQDPSDDSIAFESKLSSGLERFLAHVVVHAFEIGQRSSHDFLRHFPPHAIMEGLDQRPDLRAKILVATTGVKHKIALKKNSPSAAEDLAIALAEGEASPNAVVSLFDPDDRVRFLPAQALWAYLVEDPFWRAAKRDDAGFERAKSMVAFMLDRALKDGLVSHQEVVEGIRVEKLAQLMPRPELEMALDAALAAGRRGQSFSDGNLIAELGTKTLSAYIPLAHIWDEVIQPCIASDHGLVPANQNNDAAGKTDTVEAAIDALGSNPPEIGPPKTGETEAVAPSEGSRERAIRASKPTNRAFKSPKRAARKEGDMTSIPVSKAPPRASRGAPAPGAPGPGRPCDRRRDLASP